MYRPWLSENFFPRGYLSKTSAKIRRRISCGLGRNGFLAIAGALAFLYYLSFWIEEAALETRRLEHYMNDGVSTKPISVIRSSFDWSRVQFAFPPAKELVPLPNRTRKSLPRIQYRFGRESSSTTKLRGERRNEIRDLFRKNWSSYRKYAWKKDALLPISAGFSDQFCGWAATLVDSLDTLWIMGLKEEFDEAVAAVAEIDFGKSASPRVNMFETTIRYLGGLLSAYDLSKREALLIKAKELGDLIYAGFNTKNRMPVDFIDFEQAKTGEGLYVEHGVVSASPGTLSLEMTHLSQVTGDPKYYDAIANIMHLFYQHQNETKLPGMWPTWVSMNAEDVVSGNTFTFGGSADSLYEYIPKMYALLSGQEPMYKAMSNDFMIAAEKHIFFRPMIPDGEDILISGNVVIDDKNTTIFETESEHLTCFIGGTYALAGRLFRRQGYMETGAKLTKGCIYAYKSFPTGIMPERHIMIACKSRKKCDWDEDTWIKERQKQLEWKPHLPKGFTAVKDTRYILRPEAIESVFVLYRITGDVKYREIAWDMFRAISNGTRTDYANAAVLDTTHRLDELPKEDYMESFWLAETLKYFYLVFSPPDLISLDDYVLNTEAHPFARPK